jgi:type IV pilus assembly protein PilW
MGPRTSISGFSLVELMIALVLGLVVIGAAVSIFLSNQQTFRTTENLARLQENARFAFESMAREVREAGGTPCGTKPVANVINGGGGWWSWNAQGPLRGYAGNTPGPQAFGITSGLRATNTDAILVLSASLFEGVTITTHDPTSAQFKVNKTNHGIQNDCCVSDD